MKLPNKKSTYRITNYNQLTGTIPVEIGNMINLTFLESGSNQLKGGIPSEIGNLINLREFKV